MPVDFGYSRYQQARECIVGIEVGFNLVIIFINIHFSKKRESIPELPVWLWQSYGTMTCLLQEVISIYPAIMPPTLTAVQSNRVCNALALMQCIAAHQDTRRLFLEGNHSKY